VTRLILDLAGLVAALAWGGFFEAVHEAFEQMTQGRAGRLQADERKGAARLAEVAADPGLAIATARFLSRVGDVGVVFVFFDLCHPVASLAGRAVAAGASAAIVGFVVTGVGARTLGRQHASAVALKTAGLVRFLTAAVGFLTKALIAVGNAITPGRGYPEGPFATEDELRAYVDLAEASNEIEADERKMIHSVVDLGDTLVREVMVPRPEIVYIEQAKTLRQALSLALKSGFSRIPVVGAGGLDDIVGIAYLKDIVQRVFDHAEAQSNEAVASIVRPVTWCPDSKPADDLLREMQADRSHLVVVVDEFGGTAGLATIEDILEEIVGEIVDEFDDELPPVVDLGGGVFKVVSRLSLDDLGDLFGLELDDDDVDSVGGILAKQLNQVPLPGAQAFWRGLELTADQLMGRRHQIATVVVRRVPEAASPASPVAEGGEA
jgi:CBS domain containing-hemolysin-like protein